MAAFFSSRSSLPTSGLPHIHCLSFFLQKRTGLPVVSMEYKFKKCNNTRHKKLISRLVKAPVGGHRFHEQAKASETANPTVRNPTKTPR